MSEPLHLRLFRFTRALGVGGVATLVDFLVLTTQIRLLDVDPAWARYPALLGGAITQFIGNRTFTFHATKGRLRRQATLFVVFEGITLAMNGGLYQLLLKWLTPPLAPELVSFIGTFLVFVCFNYPMRKNVIFRIRPDASPPAEAPSPRS